ncbi:MAG: serine protein kinase PrkA [Patescibacteria group bacterium]
MKTEKALDNLVREVVKKENRKIYPFKGFLELTQEEPKRTIRNIFQVVSDMFEVLVTEMPEEYPDDPEAIGYKDYNLDRLLVDGMDHPYFADRLFANRLVGIVKSFGVSSRQNKVYFLKGRRGGGKTTFVNNLLKKIEEFTLTPEGQIFEVFWKITGKEEKSKHLRVVCPHHCHPFSVFPQPYRLNLLRDLLKESHEEFFREIETSKKFDWLREWDPCPICKCLMRQLLDEGNSFQKVLSSLFVRPREFDRRSGQGISVFNPGDVFVRQTGSGMNRHRHIQSRLDKLFESNIVRYSYSSLAGTNNGIYVLMDVKGSNAERFAGLHNIISDGVKKVEDELEEIIHSLFLAVTTPEDFAKLKLDESFEDRVLEISMAYNVSVETEIRMLDSVFGSEISNNFLPKILENFVSIIIASRLVRESEALKKWIGDFGSKYSKFCDKDGLLLKMALYAGELPRWLSEEDRKGFKAEIRRLLFIREGKAEGQKGISGRQSQALFEEFHSRFKKEERLINMQDLVTFWKSKLKKDGLFHSDIPEKFLDSVVGLYEYQILQEMKTALFYFNEDRILNDILNYIFASSFEVGSTKTNPYNGERVEITKDFLIEMGSFLRGAELDAEAAYALAEDVQKEYAEVLSQEGIGDSRELLMETEFFVSLHRDYLENQKEKVFEPILGNENFRRAVQEFGTEEFKIHDRRIKERVEHMMNVMQAKFGYTVRGVKEVCVYIIDNEVPRKFN